MYIFGCGRACLWEGVKVNPRVVNDDVHAHYHSNVTQEETTNDPGVADIRNFWQNWNDEMYSTSERRQTLGAPAHPGLLNRLDLQAVCPGQ